MRTRHILGVLAVLAALSGPAAAAAQVEWTLHPQRLRPGEGAVLTVTVRGARNAPEPALPEIDGLQVSGPSRQSQTQVRIVQGRMQQERSQVYQYRVLALRAGSYTVGPLEYTVDRQTTTLPALSLEVAAPGEPGDAAPADHGLQARILAGKSAYYTMELFEMEIEILHPGWNIERDVELMNLPGGALDISTFQEIGSTRVLRDGRHYDVRRFRATARALSPGRYRIAPTLRVGVVTPRQARDPFESFGFGDSMLDRFFGGGERHRVAVDPEPLEIEILPLPSEGRSATFSGAVGRFQFDVRIEPVTVRIGEPVTVTMMLSGQGALDKVPAPAIDTGPAFRVYDARLTETHSPRGSGLHRKVYQQALIPRSRKATRLPVISFSYFDPDEAVYRTIEHGPFDLDLQPAEEREPGDAPRLDFVAAPIAPEDPLLKSWRPGPATLWFPVAVPEAALAGVLGAPLVLLAFAATAHRKREYRTRNPGRYRRLSAPRKARRGLRAASRALQSGDTAAFFNHLAEALQRYFGDRLSIPPGNVLADRVAAVLDAGGMAAADIERLRGLFKACDAARFGDESVRQMPQTRGMNMLREAVLLLRACERIRMPS